MLIGIEGSTFTMNDDEIQEHCKRIPALATQGFPTIVVEKQVKRIRVIVPNLPKNWCSLHPDEDDCDDALDREHSQSVEVPLDERFKSIVEEVPHDDESLGRTIVTVSSSEDDDDHCLGANDNLSNPHPGTESIGEEKKGEKGVALSTRDLEEFEARLGEDPIQRKRDSQSEEVPDDELFRGIVPDTNLSLIHI